jgi:hypothetical protein
VELQVTLPRVLRLWWAYLWRNLVVVLLAMVMGGVAGAVIGIVLGMAGAPVQVIQIVSAIAGMAIGLTCSILPMWWILGKNYGEFRLVLLATDRFKVGAAGAIENA